MEMGHQLRDLLDTEKLQKLQDTLAKALGLAFVTVDYRGWPVIEYSGFTEFCDRIRKNEACRGLCYQCDAHGGLHATITGEPYVYRCHAGLVDFAVPLILEGKYMGAVMGGQVELEGEAPELEFILPQTSVWQEDQELVEARRHVHKFTYEKLTAGVYLVRDMIQSMIEEEYRKLTMAELEKKNQQLMEERNARITLEEAREAEQTAPAQTVLDENEIFYMLNVIAKLAFREKAEETERAACDAAAMIRYVTENHNTNFVTLGEELEYIECYLQFQKRRLEGRLAYEIKVPERYRGVLCPFMLFQPMVENALKYAVEPNREGGMLAIRAKAEEDQLLLAVSDSGSGMTRQQIHALLELEGRSAEKHKNYLTNMNRRLKDVFGERCGVTILSKEDGFPGTEVQIRLPLRSSGAIR